MNFGMATVSRIIPCLYSMAGLGKNRTGLITTAVTSAAFCELRFLLLVAINQILAIFAGSIDPVGGIISAVEEEIETLQTCIGVVNDVRRKESAEGGVVITALEVVEAGLTNALVTVS